MSVTENPQTATPSAAGTRQLALYEGAMCCPTGVCGPGVDPSLIAIGEDLRWAEEQGADIARYNLASDPDAFLARPKVTALIQALGEPALPALVVDGEILTHGRYPTRDELAEALGLAEPAPGQEPKAAGSGTGCC